ncbi:PREDICTED: ATP-dependent DNA helicase 2 subunit KU70 isoform X2 [Lupinus angustifolius]|uniref:ATP-dependent DNA helicase 2 subunit KU70 isoform X2 n=1 Tax=Lupinus angustifolius TaxID=3871 RepID=UPI00092E587C|nr:PREDICTED: ATP-dependent DNA helicase 2 subunit KU70 isoform X2 [Lupinus angustifolius]
MMDLDADDIFRDDDDDLHNQFSLENETSKEFVVYVVDASPKMFTTTSPSEEEGKEDETHFHIAISCISHSLKSQIINRSYDEIAICFYNTREKKNIQDLNGVFVFNVVEREFLDRPNARLIKEFDSIEETFSKNIGSKQGIVSATRENSLYNAIWVAQALLRKGSAKTVDKRMLLFTNEDDPFGSMNGAIKSDMTRTTLQRAKDARDLGISIELLPLSCPDEVFNVSPFYADLIGLEGDDLVDFMPSAGNKLEDMKDQLRKRMFTKRIVKRIKFTIANGISIDLNSYALIRPTVPGAITWLDSVTNRPLKSERTFICADTGALVEESSRRFHPYKNQNIIFSMKELIEIKRVSTGHLHLLGFKPLNCLRDYHNLKPSTFLYPSDEGMDGSICIFVALHRSMIQLNRFALAFYGSSSRPQLVALIAQDEVIQSGGQIEPPGMHMIYLPYSDDIRLIEERFSDSSGMVPKASGDQIKKAADLIKRIDLKDFSVCQFANPSLQRHYAVLQALALEEDEIPEMKDETLPDEEGLARPGVVRAIEEFKTSVYGENYDEESEQATGKPTETSRKRKAIAEFATKECGNYEWGDLADTGKLKDLTVVELKYYLAAHDLPVSGKKDALISRILTHMGK